MRRRLLAAASVLGVLFASGFPGAAQSPQPSGPLQPSAEQRPALSSAKPLSPRVGVTGEPSALRLDEAVRLALEENNDVAIARLETQSAQEDIRAVLGVYDPRLLPAIGYRHTSTPVASSIGGAANGKVEEKRVDGAVSLTGYSLWGGRFSVDFISARSLSSNTNLRLNPQFPSALGATYTQPLFQGRTIDVERHQILIARRAADLTDHQLEQVLMDQLSLVEQAYWDLVFATQNLQNQQAALGQAQAQVESNERQVGEGRLATIDVIEAQTQVARFEQTVATAQQTLTIAENRLKSLMLSNRTNALWSRPLTPADPADRAVPQLSVDEAMRLALARRPEIGVLEATVAQNAIDQQLFADQARPRVDLVGGYSLAGLAGTAVTQPSALFRTDPAVISRLNELSARATLGDIMPSVSPASAPLPEFLIGGWADSLANIANGRYPTGTVQLQVEVPLGNRTAKANLAKSRIEQTQLARQRLQLEQAIEADVRNSLQAVESSNQRLASATTARRNAQEQYDSERRRFDSGLSTVFLLLDRQTALVTAQTLELRARADLNQAIAVFDRSIGATLQQHSVKLAP
jgi:HAE1 family hydrophobic/amphiphilic exporter-1